MSFYLKVRVLPSKNIAQTRHRIYYFLHLRRGEREQRLD